MNRPSIEPILDADLRDKMFDRTGPWLREWLNMMTVEEAQILCEGGEQLVDSIPAPTA